MFGPFERAVAGRYLRARRGERFVSVIAIFSLVGIALGVATLIIVMSVMSGFKDDLLSRILGLNGHLGVYSVNSSGLTDYDALAARIRTLPGVVSATPVIEGQVLLTGRSQNSGGIVRGITQGDLRGLSSIADNIRSGSLDDFHGDDAIAVGLTLADRFGLDLGSKITLVSPDGAVTAFGTVPRVRAYRIVAIFQAGMNEYDSTFTFLPLAAAQIYFQKPGTVSQIEVMVRDPQHVSVVSRAIREELRGRPVRVIDWTQSNDSFFAAVQVEQNVMFLILTLIIVVAAFNVVSSLIMMVKDKTRDIAVLRTLGAGRGAIMRIFLMCGASVGVTGTLLGTVLGVVFCLNIERLRLWLQSLTGTTLFDPTVYYLEHLPAKLDAWTVFQVVMMALTLSLLATLYPSWRAARTDPVEALDMSEPLELRGAGRTYRSAAGDLPVLRGADLVLRRGEIVALVAPSGTGKSTLLHLAGLLERPDSGTVLVDGLHAGNLSDAGRTQVRRDKIGFVYQFHHLLAEFSALENVVLPQMIGGTARQAARQRATALLQKFGLGARLSQLPGKLSGGEQQRVAIARALANRPKVILADEPTGNLDAGTSDIVFRELLTIVREQQVACLIATHNTELASRMDRVVTLRDGLIVAQ